MPIKEMTKKEASLIQEKTVAKLLDGQVQVASGGTSHGGGDVLTDDWFFECKTVTSEKNSYSVKKSVIDKMKEQSFEQRKHYAALAFRFEPKGKDYFVIDADTFKYMFECVKQVEEEQNA